VVEAGVEEEDDAVEGDWAATEALATAAVFTSTPATPLVSVAACVAVAADEGFALALGGPLGTGDVGAGAGALGVFFLPLPLRAVVVTPSPRFKSSMSDISSLKVDR